MTETAARSRDVILREDDFAPLLAAASADFGARVVLLEEPGQLESLGNVGRLAQEADRLERFVDDFGGRHNRTFAMFGELVASVRGLALAKSTAMHLLGRLPRYDLILDGTRRNELRREIERANEVLSEALRALLGPLRDEGSRHGLRWVRYDDGHEDEPHQRRLLPRNLDATDATDDEEHIAEIGARFLRMVQASRHLDLRRVRAPEELPAYAAEFATEERCRWYESAAHNIQSMYDTYVLRTTVEQANPWLRAIRGHASVCFHLLEMATGLMHFYQRHENDIRHEPIAQAISTRVSKEQVLHLAVNVGLRQAYLVIEEAVGLADRMLETFVRQGSVELAMPAGVTLHARPLALVVQVARHYGTPLEVTLDGETCPGDSLMSLIILGGKHPTPASIHVRGDLRALRDLELLFEVGLGEGEDELPPELIYLRT